MTCSIYIDTDTVGQGVGRALYTKLFARLRAEKLHRAVAAIALPNPTSVGLHLRLGFREVGVFKKYACKKGQRIIVVDGEVAQWGIVVRPSRRVPRKVNFEVRRSPR